MMHAVAEEKGARQPPPTLRWSSAARQRTRWCCNLSRSGQTWRQGSHRQTLAFAIKVDRFVLPNPRSDPNCRECWRYIALCFGAF
jgi:hypothetical protein